MSVNVNERTGNTLEVLNLSLNLLNYTYERTQKTKTQKKTGEEETGKIYMLMDKTKPKRQRRKIKKLLSKERSGEFITGTARTSLVCWISNAQRGDCGGIIYRMKKFYNNEVKGYGTTGF